jgi:hypothetical protein
MGQVTLSGTLTAGPPAACSGFPSTTLSAALGFGGGGCGCSKSFNAASGLISRTVNSPAAFVPLSAIGPNGDVTQGDFLYFRTESPVDLRITIDDGAGGTTVITQRVGGIYLQEFDPRQPLELLEIRGSSRIEYFVSGPS